MKHSANFGVDLENIPLINLRAEYNEYYQLLRDESFCAQFADTIQSIETPYMIWLAMPDDFLSLLIQRAVSGIESYLRGAIYIEAGMAGVLNHENAKYIHNPWELGGRTVTENYYHRLPALLRESSSLKVGNQSLWADNEHFYKEIRNPIFHGHHLHKTKIDKFRELHDHVSYIYAWIDGWHNPENLIRGGSTLSLVSDE